MEHLVTIPKRSLDSIISGQKRMECVFVKDSEEHPYASVQTNDVLFFTPRGGLASIRARVTKVECFDDVDYGGIEALLKKNRDLLAREDLQVDARGNSKHAMLVHFDNVLDIKPFRLNESSLKTVRNSRWISVNKFFDIRNDISVR